MSQAPLYQRSMRYFILSYVLLHLDCKSVGILIENLRNYTSSFKRNSQIFITTHQPYLVDMLDPEEVWVLKKGVDGFSTIERTSEIPYVKEMVDEGQPLGALWYSDYLDR